jgi:peptidoglycan-associated lipoprotein
MSKSSFLILIVLAVALAIPGCSKNKRTESDGYPVAVEKSDIPDARRGQGSGSDRLPVRPTRTEDADQGALKTIYFDFDRSNIRPDQRSILDANKDYLAANPQKKVVIEGHCDERGTKEYNFALGERRANSVREYLILMGIDASRLAVVSKGEDQPAQSGTGESVWAKNRRTEFKVTASDKPAREGGRTQPAARGGAGARGDAPARTR